MKILVINGGSSSLKFRLYEMPSQKLICSGLVERIGEEQSFVKCSIIIDDVEKSVEREFPIADHGEAVRQILVVLTAPSNRVISDIKEIEIVGHRVVHGGETFSEATIITDEVKEKILQLFSIAPLHNPVNYRCIEVTQHFFPDAKQVAVFDTAFHQTLPPKAYRYAIPNSFYKEDGIRVYGFHGISHKYITQKAREYMNKPNAKMISIHLGNGCSMTAVEGDKSLDTSMGFSPLNGLVMGTRSGELDPSIIFHMASKLGLSLEQINTMLNKESGLIGLCDMNDMRDIRRAVEEGNKEAAFACELYAYRIRKYIGAYAAVLNGLDAIIFSAGVGENDVATREQVCTNMEFLGISLDKARNQQRGKDIFKINTDESSVKIFVIATNEELEIAIESYELCNNMLTALS
jgi:acetate kinase